MILQSASISRTSDTLVFAPTFNERQTIGPLLDDLLSMPGRFDVLIVDDLSVDGTAEYVAERAASEPRLRLIMRSGKFGVGSAHKLAWLEARQQGYSRLVTLDADLSHDPRTHFMHAPVVGGALRGVLRVQLAQRAGRLAARERHRAVLGHDGVHRPGQGEGLAPAHGPAGDGKGPSWQSGPATEL